MFELLSKLPFNRAVNIALVIFGFIICPFWYSFNFLPDVMKLDLIPLIFCLIAISLPPGLIFLFFILLNSLYTKKLILEEPKDIIFSWLAESSFYGVFAFYTPCIAILFFDISKKQSIYIVIAVFFVFLIIESIYLLLNYKEYKKLNDSSTGSQVQSQ